MAINKYSMEGGKMDNNKKSSPQDIQTILTVFRIRNKQGIEARHQLKFEQVDSIREICKRVNDFIKTISKENPFELVALEIIPQIEWI